MSLVQVAVLLVGILVGIVLALIACGLRLGWKHPNPTSLWNHRDDLLIGLLAFAAFALGVFLTYVIMGAAR